MPAGPIGSSWASGSWEDTAWEEGSWADAGSFPLTLDDLTTIFSARCTTVYVATPDDLTTLMAADIIRIRQATNSHERDVNTDIAIDLS